MGPLLTAVKVRADLPRHASAVQLAKADNFHPMDTVFSFSMDRYSLHPIPQVCADGH